MTKEKEKKDINLEEYKNSSFYLLKAYKEKINSSNNVLNKIINTYYSEYKTDQKSSYFLNILPKIESVYKNKLWEIERLDTISKKWFDYTEIPKELQKEYIVSFLGESIRFSKPINFYQFVKRGDADILIDLIKKGYSLKKLKTISRDLFSADINSLTSNLKVLDIFDELNSEFVLTLSKDISRVEKKIDSVLINFLMVYKINYKDKKNYKVYESDKGKKFVQTTISSNIISNKKITSDMSPDEFIDTITLGQKISFIRELNISERNKALFFALQFIDINKMFSKTVLPSKLSNKELELVNFQFDDLLKKVNEVRNLTHHNNFMFHRENIEIVKDVLLDMKKYMTSDLYTKVIGSLSLLLEKIMKTSSKISSEKFYTFILNNFNLR